MIFQDLLLMNSIVHSLLNIMKLLSRIKNYYKYLISESSSNGNSFNQKSSKTGNLKVFIDLNMLIYAYVIRSKFFLNQLI